ncbi:hypothetical protein V4R08_12150 [Nitrobacter sp. NHB1]|uniref:hypothetical protein n=1 Tax=Nitrobacter sp. NHB1 TaxID=3119830 RepID=UPI002FFE60D0
MTSDEPATRSGKGRRTIPGELSALMREDLRALGGWIGLIIASLIAFWLTEGTQYHQLAAGLLMSSSTLFILMALFECLWRLFVGRSP